MDSNIEMLPKQSSSAIDYEATPIYNRLGIEVIGVANDLYYNVRLPEGWRIDYDEDNSSFQKRRYCLINEHGHNRGFIAAKTAPWDQWAIFHMSKRYRIEQFATNPDYQDDIKYGMDIETYFVIYDAQERLTVWEGERFMGSSMKPYSIAVDTLKEMFPDCDDEWAYWD